MLRGGLSYYRALAIIAIKNERRRQIEEEGWTPDHDDAHNDASLRIAGECYLRAAVGEVEPGALPEGWPWAPAWWKSHGPMRDLVRAGALFEAEIDRLDRYHRQVEGFDGYPVRTNVKQVIWYLAILYRHDDESVPF